MSFLFGKPRIPTPTMPAPTPRAVSTEDVEKRRTDLRKRLAAMQGRASTVLTGPLGETNRRTVLGA